MKKFSSATYGRLSAIEFCYAESENKETESVAKLVQDVFAKENQVDRSLRNKLIQGVKDNKEDLQVLLKKYEKNENNRLFQCLFFVAVYELKWLKKSLPIVWSEYQKIAELFFPESVQSVFKAVLNKIDVEING